MKRRITAFAAALAIAFVVPSSDVLAGKTHQRSPVVTVLNDTALGGLGREARSGLTAPSTSRTGSTARSSGSIRRPAPRRWSAGACPQAIGIGGAMDVAFIGHRAYVLVTLAGADVGVPDAVMGIYRLKRDGTFSVFADLGTWSAAHPPKDPDWFLPQGVQYSLDVWRNGFVVADAHLGRVIRVNLRGRISELVAFDSTDSVPTGLEVGDDKVFVATAGPSAPPVTSEINVVRPTDR